MTTAINYSEPVIQDRSSSIVGKRGSKATVDSPFCGDNDRPMVSLL